MPLTVAPPDADTTIATRTCPDCSCECANEAAGRCNCYDDVCSSCSCGVATCAECACPCDNCNCGETRCEGCYHGSLPCNRCQCRCSDCECRYELCDRCDCDHAPQTLINSYGTRVERRLKFQGKPKDSLVESLGMRMRDTTFFGVELEVEVDRNSSVDAAAEKTLALLGRDFVMLKSDGSINRGFEIVSAPATLDVHRERWTKFLENRPRSLFGWNSGTCGMHVHISRPIASVKGGSLGSLHLGKMLVFMNDNAHRQQIVAIAGRQSHWGKFARRTLNDGKSGTYIDTGRYSALNITNEKTLEVRIFRSTLSPAGFMRNLEFCHAMFYFTRDTSARDLSWESFTAFVKKERAIYPSLTEFIEEKIENDGERAKRLAAISKRGLDADNVVISKIKGDVQKQRLERRRVRAAITPSNVDQRAEALAVSV